MLYAFENGALTTYVPDLAVSYKSLMTAFVPTSEPPAIIGYLRAAACISLICVSLPLANSALSLI